VVGPRVERVVLSHSRYQIVRVAEATQSSILASRVRVCDVCARGGGSSSTMDGVKAKGDELPSSVQAYWSKLLSAA
jgi:hypothetical protein